MQLTERLSKLTDIYFKPGRRTLFLEISFVREVSMRVCVFVCLCASGPPQPIKNYSREMKFECQSNKWPLVTKHIMSYEQGS